jgi:hypothetical protein
MRDSTSRPQPVARPVRFAGSLVETASAPSEGTPSSDTGGADIRTLAGSPEQLTSQPASPNIIPRIIHRPAFIEC